MRRLILVMVALVPVLLIGYSVGASAMVPGGDVLVVLCALLITGVGGFVIADTLLVRSRPLHAMRPVKIGRRSATFRR